MMLHMLIIRRNPENYVRHQRKEDAQSWEQTHTTNPHETVQHLLITSANVPAKVSQVGLWQSLFPVVPQNSADKLHTDPWSRELQFKPLISLRGSVEVRIWVWGIINRQKAFRGKMCVGAHMHAYVQ